MRTRGYWAKWGKVLVRWYSSSDQAEDSRLRPKCAGLGPPTLVRNRHLDKEEIYQFLRNYTGKENRFQVAAKEFNIGLSTAYKIYHIYGRLI